MDGGTIAAATAGGGLQLATMLQRGATLNDPFPEPRTLTTPRLPREGGQQSPRRGDTGERTINPAQDPMEVSPASPPPSPSGAATAAGPAAPWADYDFGDWGFDGMREGTVPPSRTPQEQPGPAGGGSATVVTAGATAQPVNIGDDMNEFVFESSEENFLGESFESDSMASVSDGRSPTYVVAGDGRKKIKWPRKNGKKVRSVFGHDHFPFEPVDPTREGGGGVEETKTGHVQEQEEPDQEMDDRSDAMSSSDDSDSAAAPLGRGLGRTGGRSWMSGRLGRSKKGPDQGAYFLYLLRTEFPEIWATIVAGPGDAVICVPQSTSLSQEDLTVAEARAHVLSPSREVPGDFFTLDGWSVSLVGNEVVTGAGFPESRRVRLLLSEDLGHYLATSGEQPFPMSSSTLPGGRGEGGGAATGGGSADEGRPAAADRGGSSGGDGGGGGMDDDAGDDQKKTSSATKVVSLRATSTHGDKKTGKETSGDDDDDDTRKEAVKARERKVRLMHVSRPLMGGLSWAPENAGELDMITVDKYTAVLKSYPEVDGMFAEMDSFAKAVLNYCSKNLASRAESGTTSATAASAAAATADRREGDGGGSGGPAPLRQRARPEEEELCAVVAEQWRLTAATLTRSRCVKGNGDAEARERREVTMMQVTESYLMSRLAPGLGTWLAALKAEADRELCRALRLLQHHTQEDIGVKASFQCDLSLAVNSLRSLALCATPMDKMLQVKECLKLIQTSVQKHMDVHRGGDSEDGDDDDDDDEGNDTENPASGGQAGRGAGAGGGGGQEYDEDAQMATDDIVLLLVCCLIEVGTSGGGGGSGGSGDGGGCATFLADLAFVKAFHFCEDSTSAVYFALSTFEVALEWILAKVGRRLAETPAEDGLGSFLALEDRPSPPPPAAADADDGGGNGGGGGGGGDGRGNPQDGGGDGGGVGAWGGEELWVVPAALCDVALRENVATELEARRGSGGGMGVALEDLQADPTKAFPWEPRLEGAVTGTTVVGGSGVVGTGGGGSAAGRGGAGGQGQGSGCDRGMVFGDAGKWESEQTAMFQVREGGDSAGGRGGGQHVDIVQVSCGKHFFAAVTRKGGLHTWGLDASDGRLGHGGAVGTGAAAAAAAAATAAAAAAAAAAGGGAGAAAGAGTGEGAGVDAAARPFWLKAPARVEALARENVVQVSCGAKHTLVVTADGRLFAWGDNRYGQCGLPWPSRSSSSPGGSGGGSGDGGGGRGGELGLKTAGGDNIKRKKSGFFSEKLGASAEVAAGKKDGGDGGGGGGGGMVVPQPMQVFLRKDDDDVPLRVIQVACGRQHSLALARPRNNSKATGHDNGGGGAAAAAASAPGSSDNAGGPNLLMPGVVTADWTYRVNDHRQQGAPLVPVGAARGIYPFGSGRGGRGPVAIAAGWRHSVAVTEEGAAFTWGCGAGGKLGLGSHVDVDTPRQVRALASRAVRIRRAAAGRSHTVFLSDSGTVYSCGSDEFGQQGRGGGATRAKGDKKDGVGVGADGDGDGDGGAREVSASRCVLAPTAVAAPGGEDALSGLRVESVAAGDDHCTVLTGGGGGCGGDAGTTSRRRVFTWGSNAAGQCAQGRAAEVVWASQEAELLSGARSVACGAGHTMVVL
eukprot:g13213.t1